MHDIKAIRDNPQAFDAGLARRGAEPAAARILELDERRRAVATRMQEAQARRNEASKAIGAAMGPVIGASGLSVTGRIGSSTCNVHHSFGVLPFTK